MACQTASAPAQRCPYVQERSSACMPLGTNSDKGGPAEPCDSTQECGARTCVAGCMNSKHLVWLHLVGEAPATGPLLEM